MKKIHIDTTSNEEVRVVLEVDGEQCEKKGKVGRDKAQVVLPLIEDLLSDKGLNLTDIEEIMVNEGPGSFTGIRVGISVAQALGYALNIPVNGKQAGDIIEPQYE